MLVLARVQRVPLDLGVPRDFAVHLDRPVPSSGRVFGLGHVYIGSQGQELGFVFEVFVKLMPREMTLLNILALVNQNLLVPRDVASRQ